MLEATFPSETVEIPFITLKGKEFIENLPYGM